jgi:hypothetical protein
MLTILLVAAGSAVAQPNTLTPKETKQGWTLLFDGKSLDGWTAIGDPRWAVEDGAIVALPGTRTLGWLRSSGQYGDFHLKLDFKTREHGNSGVFLRAATDGQPHVTGYELQIWTGNEKYPTGSLVNHVSTNKGKFNGDVWNTYDVMVKGNHFVIRLNGKVVLETDQTKSGRGHIGLQSNQDRIEFRNLKIRPL